MNVPPMPGTFHQMEPQSFDVPMEDNAIEVEIGESPATDFSDENLHKLAAHICDLFQEGERVRDNKSSVWERNRKDYANEPIPFIANIIEDASDIPINHASTKADSLRDLVCGALFSTRPFATVSVRGESGNENHKLEAVMQRILERANLEERCKEASEDVWCTNHAIFRCYWDGDLLEYTIDTVDPECFVVAGGDKFGIVNSILVGHSYDERIADIEYGIESGEYLEYPDGVWKDSDTTEEALLTHKLAQVFVRLDGDELKKENRVCPVKDWYICTVDTELRHILKIAKYTLSDRPWYFSGSYLPCKKNGGFWSKHSLGAFMQGPHMAYAILMNTAVYGGVGRAFPPTVSEGEFTDQNSQLKWGQTKVTYGGNVTAPYQQFDPSNLEMAMARVERIGDGVARISQAAAGQTFNKGMTATEAQIIAQAQSQGVSGYVSTFAITLEEIVQYIHSTLKFTAPKLLETMDATLQPETGDLWTKDAVWTATGRGQFASPALRMAQLEQLVQMSQDPRLVGKFDIVEIAESIMANMNLPNQERIFDRNRATPPPPPTLPPAMPGGGPPSPGGGQPPGPEGAGGNPQMAGGM